MNRESSDIHSPALEVDEEQHVVGHQPAQRQHLGGEEVGAGQQLHVGPDEGGPCGRALALRRGRQTVAPQNIADRLIGIRRTPDWSTPLRSGHSPNPGSR